MSNDELQQVYKRGNYLLLGSRSQFDSSNLIIDCPWIFTEINDFNNKLLKHWRKKNENNKSIQLSIF